MLDAAAVSRALAALQPWRSFIAPAPPYVGAVVGRCGEAQTLATNGSARTIC